MLLRNDAQMALNQVESLLVESADHYEATAGKTNDRQLSQLFTGLAQQRGQLAAGLAAHIRALDDLPQHPDPDKETVEDLITSLKTLFSGNERITLIDERVRFEDQVAQAVEAARRQVLPEDTKVFLQHILAHVHEAKRLLTEGRE